MDLLSTIITAIVSMATGGVVSSFFTLRYQKKKAKAEADKSTQSVVDMQVKTAQDLIEMYKSSVEDIKKLSEQREEILKKKVEELELSNKELNSQVEKLSKLTNEQSKKIDELTRIQGQLKLKIEQVRLSSDNVCEYCEFKNQCKKYEIKKMNQTQHE